MTWTRVPRGGAAVSSGRWTAIAAGRVGDREERRRPEAAGLGDHDAGHGHERADRSAPRVGDGLAAGRRLARETATRSVSETRSAPGSESRVGRGLVVGAGVGDGDALGVGDGDGVGLGVGVGSGVDGELPGQRRVEPVAGEARAAAVALAERPDRGDDVAGPDAGAGPRGIADHEPERPAAVVDRDAEPVAQRVRRGRHRARHDQPQCPRTPHRPRRSSPRAEPAAARAHRRRCPTRSSRRHAG